VLGLHDALATLAQPWLWPRVGELHAPPSPLGSWAALQRWLSCLAPLNALRYNSQTSNLAEHGIHPRVTHALVNLPLMFGPLALYLYYRVFRVVLSDALAVARARKAPPSWRQSPPPLLGQSRRSRAAATASAPRCRSRTSSRTFSLPPQWRAACWCSRSRRTRRRAF
jgi:hypothetical protein